MGAAHDNDGSALGEVIPGVSARVDVALREPRTSEAREQLVRLVATAQSALALYSHSRALNHTLHQHVIETRKALRPDVPTAIERRRDL